MRPFSFVVLASFAALGAAVPVAHAQSCDAQWLSGAVPALNGTAYCSVMWDRDGSGPLPPALVVGGSFTLAGSVAVSNLALWDGVAWSDIGGGVSGTIHGTTAVNALAVMPNGDLIVGGAFDNAGTGLGQIAAACIARYNGSAWSALGLGLPQAAASVRSMTVRTNGDLIAMGGIFANTDNTTAGPLCSWNDSSSARWSDFGNPLPAIESLRVVYALSNGDVMLGGVQGTATGASAVWRWNSLGAQWQTLGAGVVGGTAPLNQVFSALELANGDIVLAGNFTSAGGTPANSIARWNGSQFSALGSGITFPTKPFLLAVRALAQMPNGDIVAGGNFDTAGGTVGGNIARWNSATWTRLPQGAGDIVWSLLRTPQNELAIGGAYTFAGGSFANKRIARFTDNPAPWAARDPAPQSIADGANAAFTAAAATGFVGASFHWQRNGVDISDGPGGASLGGGTVAGSSGSLASPTTGALLTLTITGAHAGDSGEYRVMFTNSCGSGSSAAAELTVSPPPCPADFNGDGFADIYDFTDFVNCFEGTACPPGKSADFNSDGFADIYDFTDFVDAFELGC